MYPTVLKWPTFWPKWRLSIKIAKHKHATNKIIIPKPRSSGTEQLTLILKSQTCFLTIPSQSASISCNPQRLSQNYFVHSCKAFSCDRKVSWRSLVYIGEMGLFTPTAWWSDVEDVCGQKDPGGDEEAIRTQAEEALPCPLSGNGGMSLALSLSFSLTW